jgi:hypothetical protein
LQVVVAGAVTLLSAAGTWAQSVLTGFGPGGLVRLHNTDTAVLEVPEARKDLPCNVSPVKALVGFDMRFHAGYEVSIPLRDLAGPENLLTVIFRVTPENLKDEPYYFSQRIRVPAIEEDAKGDAYLQGAFDVGEGKYHVDWLMRDRSERVCSDYWEVEAFLTEREKDMGLVLAPSTVHSADSEPFREEPPVERSHEEQPVSVKVLINFAPQDSASAVLRPLDTSALVSILRTISREPRFGRFSLIAFNLQEQRVVYRQENADRIDFPALGEALSSLNLGTVDLKRLSQKNGETQFLADLIKRETGGASPPDGLIFAGPKALLPENVAAEELKSLGQLDYPVFYMNYNLYPQAAPWRDAIGAAVKFFKGTEFTISRPRDLWRAVTEMVSRIVKSKNERRTVAASAR